MIKDISSTTVLNNGVRMPWLGFGTWQMEVESSIKIAVKSGYRSIDTATAYGNETGVGNAVRECGMLREDLFITTKVWNSNQGYDSTIRAFEESLKKLGLAYLDIYLIHWPVKGKYMETWKAFEKLYTE
ncbi:MAG: aldo/keto reductase [Clostridiales bacterium]|nr:aldo/keto reductase [Clostridiales bacterium]